MGSFGGHFAADGQWVTAQSELVRSQTDKPFGIGFITPFLHLAEPHFQAAIDARPAAIVLSFADPGDAARRVKDAGLRLICQVQRLVDVPAALDAGADVLVVQGNEAGGHTGEMGLLPLLSMIADRYDSVPLLAAGGIASGRTLAAAVVAGADGAMVGTAFLATPEAVEVTESHKAAIVSSDGGDTVFTRTYDIATRLPWPSHIGVRVRRDAFTDAWGAREDELRSSLEQVTLQSAPLFYGESAGMVAAVRPAADVVRSLCDDAEQRLRTRPMQLSAD
jgi:nitronate monooxygenase